MKSILLTVICLLPLSLSAQMTMKMGSPAELYMETHRLEEGSVWWVESMDSGCFFTIQAKDEQTYRALVQGDIPKPGQAPMFTMIVDPQKDKIVFVAPYPLTLGNGVTLKIQCEPGNYMNVRVP